MLGNKMPKNSLSPPTLPPLLRFYDEIVIINHSPPPIFSSSSLWQKFGWRMKKGNGEGKGD
jgi:hypothetical protein